MRGSCREGAKGLFQLIVFFPVGLLLLLVMLCLPINFGFLRGRLNGDEDSRRRYQGLAAIRSRIVGDIDVTLADEGSLPAGYHVVKTSVLGGLHHEYRLVKEAA